MVRIFTGMKKPDGYLRVSFELEPSEIRFLCNNQVGHEPEHYLDRFVWDIREAVLDAYDSILESSKGRKTDSESVNVGSNPASRAEPEIGSTEWWDEHHKAEQYYG